MKVNILAILPYEGMKKILLNLLENWSDVSVDIRIGNLNEGVKCLKECNEDDYDVIISRGGTAKLLEKETNLPVICVEFSAYDILRSISLAQVYSGRFALVGFHTLTRNAEIVKKLLQRELDIFTIKNYEEAEQTIRYLEEKHYRLVLCDTVSDTLAKFYGLNSILITSGSESLEIALKQAADIGAICRRYKNQILFSEKGMTMGEQEIVVLDETKKVVYSYIHTLEEEQLLPVIEKVIEEGDGSRGLFQKKINNYMVSGKTEYVERQGNCYTIVVFNVREVVQNTGEKKGIQYFFREEAVKHFLQYFHGIHCAAFPKTILEMQDYEVFHHKKTILICGELGTGKSEAAAAIYIQSPLQNNPFISIDFRVLTEKGIRFLFQHSDSPLYGLNSTICFHNIDALEEKDFYVFYSIIVNSELHKRNRLIFVCDQMPGKELDEKYRYLLYHLECQNIELLPLRKQKNYIAVLSSLYIASFNQEYAKEIAGIKEQAQELLEDYEWPGNELQFKRVMSQLVLNSTDPYIDAELVERVLESENSLLRTSEKEISVQECELDLTKTLAEIEYEIVKRVIKRNNGNQTKAAYQLGIGRSTLWRMLGKNEK